MTFLKALAVWLSFGVVAFTLGALREVFLRPRVGELRAHQIGTLLVVGVVAAIIFSAIRWLRPSAKQAVAMGGMWTGLTVIFEFGFFHYAMGEPWERLVANYDMSKGRLWPLVLLVQLVGPYVALLRQSRYPPLSKGEDRNET